MRLEVVSVGSAAGPRFTTGFHSGKPFSLKKQFLFLPSSCFGKFSFASPNGLAVPCDESWGEGWGGMVWPGKEAKLSMWKDCLMQLCWKLNFFGGLDWRYVWTQVCHLTSLLGSFDELLNDLRKIFLLLRPLLCKQAPLGDDSVCPDLQGSPLQVPEGWFPRGVIFTFLWMINISMHQGFSRSQQGSHTIVLPSMFLHLWNLSPVLHRGQARCWVCGTVG